MSAPRPGGATTVTGVMGHPIAHSLSPLLFNTAFEALGLDWAMVAFDVAEGATADALDAVRALGVAGLSVTMPHKEEACRLADECSAVAARLGAVNSIRWRDGRLSGHNTDGAGLVASLAHGAGFSPSGARCMVLGAGGAARAAVLGLAEAGASEVVVVNRSADRAAEAAALADARGRVGTADEARAVDLVVQATPVGMRDTATEATAPLVDPSLLHEGQLAVDLVYHPLETAWLAAARGQGANVLGGLGMLVHQAAVQLEWWTGLEAPVQVMWEAAARAAESR
jgi:shikimate dehydrogenase